MQVVDRAELIRYTSNVALERDITSMTEVETAPVAIPAAEIIAAGNEATEILKLRNSTNPKDTVGALKITFGVCSGVAKVYWAMAMSDGAYKYGEMNWRNKSVKMSVYLDAMERHLTALRAGEDLDHDPVSGAIVPHSGRIMACCSIIEDARASGNLIDDRRAGDKTADLLKALTQQNYTVASLALVRTPAKTLDEVRGAPFDFKAFTDEMRTGQQAFAAFKKEQDNAAAAHT